MIVPTSKLAYEIERELKRHIKATFDVTYEPSTISIFVGIRLLCIGKIVKHEFYSDDIIRMQQAGKDPVDYCTKVVLNKYTETIRNAFFK